MPVRSYRRRVPFLFLLPIKLHALMNPAASGLVLSLWLAALCLLASTPLRAEDNTSNAVKPVVSWHGFGTLGLTRTDNDNAEFVRDLTQPAGAGKSWTAKIDSLLGIQANIDFNPQTEAVVQVVSRYHADGSYDPELTWAFLRHDFSPDFSLRAGRLGTEFYMLGDSRLVGYSNLALRPPPDFYGSLVFSYIDGLDVSTTLPIAGGLLRGKLFAGLSPEETPFAPGIRWDQRGSLLVGGYLDFLRGPWQLRFSHAQVRFNHETPTDELLRSIDDLWAGTSYFALVPDMAMVDRWARFSSLGLVYDQGPLNIQFMLNQIKQDSPAYADSKAGYVQAAYRLQSVTPYLGISRSLTSREALPNSISLDPLLNILIDTSITPTLVAQSYLDQHTYTLGVRWDVHKNMALKAQVDWIRGTPNSLFLVKNPQPGWDGDMTVFSLALDFVF